MSAHAPRTLASLLHWAGACALALVLVSACVPASSGARRGEATPTEDASAALPGPAAASAPDAVAANQRRSGQGGRRASGNQVRVGAMLSLSGPAAAHGAAQRNGLRMAVDDVNAARSPGSTTLSLFVEDGGADRAQAIQAFDKLVQGDQAIAIVGPTSSSIALTIAPLAQEAGVPVIGISDTAMGVPEMGDFIFRDSLADAQVIPRVVRTVATARPLGTAALAYDQDTPLARTNLEVFRKALQASQVQVVTEQAFSSSEGNVRGVAEPLVQAQPDVLCIAARPDDAAALLVAAREAGLQRTLVLGDSAFNSPRFLSAAGAAAEGAIAGAGWSVDLPNETSRVFVQRYRERYGADPDVFAAQAYAGVTILADALQRAHTRTDRRALRDALMQVKDLDTVLGRFTFTSSGDARRPAVVQIVRGGQWHVYSPESTTPAPTTIAGRP